MGREGEWRGEGSGEGMEEEVRGEEQLHCENFFLTPIFGRAIGGRGMAPLPPLNTPLESRHWRLY